MKRLNEKLDAQLNNNNNNHHSSSTSLSASQSTPKFTKHLPLLQHVLLPRTKGFTYLLKNLPTSIDVIYDVTAGYIPNGLYIHHPLLYGSFECNNIHLHILLWWFLL